MDISNKSILLIGMTGCGKTTIGKLVSDKLEYNFIDMDQYIEHISGQSIPMLFSVSEDNFRNWETTACRELCNIKEIIISSGGGIIKKEENINFFKDKFIIVFIDRPVENIFNDIDVAKRPLLSKGKEVLYKLKEERYELYNRYCDYIVDNDGDIEEVIQKIIEIVNN